MSTNANTQTIADRITSVAELRGLSVNALMAAAGVSKSVVDRLKAGTMPAADKIAAIAGALSVPTRTGMDGFFLCAMQKRDS